MQLIQYKHDLSFSEIVPHLSIFFIGRVESQFVSLTAELTVNLNFHYCPPDGALTPLWAWFSLFVQVLYLLLTYCFRPLIDQSLT